MTCPEKLSCTRPARRGPSALTLLLAALLVAGPALPALAAGPASTGPASLWHWLDAWMARAFGADGTDAGGSMDPDGFTALPPTTGDAGGDMDPNGLLARPAASDAGPSMDPNGYSVTGTGTDAGPGMDPNGLTTTATGEAGGGMDPNG